MTVQRVLATGLTVGLCATLLAESQPALAGPREQAKKIFNRLTGVPPAPQVLDEMEAMVMQGRGEDAAKKAMDDPRFYSLGLRTWISGWTNIDDNQMVPLNDYTATVIGIILDDIPFNRVLSDDIIYVGGPNAGVQAAYSAANNTHYQQLQDSRVDLKANLVQRQQSAVSGIAQPAGILTTRGFGEAFFSAGTNRRAVRFTLKNFMCMDMEKFSDTSRADFRIRRDVDRSPGGDSTVFRNKCAGCHAGMDALAGAFAFYDFDGNRVVNNAGQVAAKFNQNGDIFPDGFVTTNDTWMNLWTAGPNQAVGWRGAINGTGAKSFGEMVTQTDAFSSCMAKRVFTKLCLRPPAAVGEIETVSSLAKGFEEDNFNMKNLFAKTAVYCTEE